MSSHTLWVCGNLSMLRLIHEKGAAVVWGMPIQCACSDCVSDTRAAVRLPFKLPRGTWVKLTTLIARFMGPVWAHLGPTGPPGGGGGGGACWPHERYSLGSTKKCKTQGAIRAYNCWGAFGSIHPYSSLLTLTRTCMYHVQDTRDISR